MSRNSYPIPFANRTDADWKRALQMHGTMPERTWRDFALATVPVKRMRNITTISSRAPHLPDPDWEVNYAGFGLPGMQFATAIMVQAIVSCVLWNAMQANEEESWLAAMQAVVGNPREEAESARNYWNRIYREVRKYLQRDY